MASLSSAPRSPRRSVRPPRSRPGSSTARPGSGPTGLVASTFERRCALPVSPRSPHGRAAFDQGRDLARQAGGSPPRLETPRHDRRRAGDSGALTRGRPAPSSCATGGSKGRWSGGNASDRPRRRGRGLLVGGCDPHVCECLGQGRLLVVQLDGAVAHPSWLDEHDLRVRREEVGGEVLFGTSPAARLHAVTGRPRARRSQWRAPRLGRFELGGPGVIAAVGGNLPTADTTAHPRVRWSAGRCVEGGQAVDLVAKRSTRTGASAVEGKMSTIPPRTASSPRCSTWCSRR